MFYIADFAEGNTKPKKKKNYYQDVAGDTIKGTGAGGGLGAVLGAVAGYKSGKPVMKKTGFLGLKKKVDKEKTKAERIKRAKKGAVRGAALGSYLGGIAGNVAGDTRNTLGNIQKKAKSPRDDRRRRFARGSQALTGSGLTGAVVADLTAKPGKGKD